MAGACLSAAAMNVRINAKDLDDPKLVAAWLDELSALEATALEHQQVLQEVIKDRARF